MAVVNCVGGLVQELIAMVGGQWLQRLRLYLAVCHQSLAGEQGQGRAEDGESDAVAVRSTYQ